MRMISDLPLESKVYDQFCHSDIWILIEVYFVKIFKELYTWIFANSFNTVKYIERLEKKSIVLLYDLVFSDLLISDYSDLRSLWMCWSLSLHLIFFTTLMMTNTWMNMFVMQVPGNGILMSNAEKSFALYCPCPPRKSYENKTTMSLIFFKIICQISLKAFLNSVTFVKYLFTFWFVATKIR